MRLTPEELAAIETTVRVTFGEYGYMRTNTVQRLLAHIDALQAECASMLQVGGYAYLDGERTRLQREADTARHAAELIACERDRLRAECDGLREACEQVQRSRNDDASMLAHSTSIDLNAAIAVADALNRYGHSQGGIVTAREPKKGQSEIEDAAGKST